MSSPLDKPARNPEEATMSDLTFKTITIGDTFIGPVRKTIPFRDGTIEIATWEGHPDPIFALVLALLAIDDSGRAEAVLKALGVRELVDAENRRVWP